MVSVQPVLSLKYFHLSKNKVPKGIKRLFYLSWEDALWDILLKKHVPKGSYILVPDFYCTDVVKNIKQHGYNVATYKIKKDLRTDKCDFVNRINKYEPAVVVIFHPVGITSNLFENKNWLAKVTGESILIEDSVHRVLDPSKIKIIKKNHFVIDSLRKVVPIQGSDVYGRVEDIDFSSPKFSQSFIYKTKVNILWFLMELAWTFKLFSPAEKFMIAGYDLIGNSEKAASGTFLSDFFATRINAQRLFKLKKTQIDVYEKKLAKVLPIKIEFQNSDKSQLRGYPVILPKNAALKLIKVLRANGILVRFELEGSGWTKNKKIVYLPIGPQVTKNYQYRICELSYNTLNEKIRRKASYRCF